MPSDPGFVDYVLDDGPWLSEMVRITVRELPPPRARGRGKSGGARRG